MTLQDQEKFVDWYKENIDDTLPDSYIEMVLDYVKRYHVEPLQKENERLKEESDYDHKEYLRLKALIQSEIDKLKRELETTVVAFEDSQKVITGLREERDGFAMDFYQYAAHKRGQEGFIRPLSEILNQFKQSIGL